MTRQEFLQPFLSQLELLYDKDEANAIVRILIADILNESVVEQKRINEQELKNKDTEILLPLLHRLLQNEPLQYVTGKTFFLGNEFHVNPSVLIPRPETEEMVDLALKLFNANAPIKILDVGTGSGCIAISLRLAFSQSEVYAVDISQPAINTAIENAANLNASVSFVCKDFLIEDPFPSEKFDLIVSNPPYISDTEKNDMHNNVLKFEPHIALFAPGKDPLIFYRTIAAYSIYKINANGIVLVEMNETLATQTQKIFTDAGFGEAEIIFDLQGKPRVLLAKK